MGPRSVDFDPRSVDFHPRSLDLGLRSVEIDPRSVPIGPFGTGSGPIGVAIEPKCIELGPIGVDRGRRSTDAARDRPIAGGNRRTAARNRRTAARSLSPRAGIARPRRDFVDDEVDAVSREASRGGRGPFVAPRGRPRRVIDEQRELHARPSVSAKRRAPASTRRKPPRASPPRPTPARAPSPPAPPRGLRRLARRARARTRRLDLALDRRQRPRLPERAQQVEREHVRRPLPDRQHLRVAQDARQPRVLDVARAAERLEHLARHRHRLLARRELRDRREQAQELRLLLGERPRLLACRAAPPRGT